MSTLDKIFATEQIAKAIISLGFSEPCIGKHAGFKYFGEGDEKLRDKFVYNTDKDGPWTEIQQAKQIPFFTICPAPVWQQVTDWLSDTHNIDIDVVRIFRPQITPDVDFPFEYSVMIDGIVSDSGRSKTRLGALEEAVLSAIELLNKSKV